MDLEIAAGFGECSVCFEPLCTKGASVMVDGSGQAAGFLRSERLPKRVCRHFLCQEVCKIVCGSRILPTSTLYFSRHDGRAHGRWLPSLFLTPLLLPLMLPPQGIFFVLKMSSITRNDSALVVNLKSLFFGFPGACGRAGGVSAPRQTRTREVHACSCSNLTIGFFN